MNDIIKLVIFNILLFGILKYDKRYSIPIIVIMIIYWITIQSSIRNKIVEGNGFFDNFVKLPEFTVYDYSTTLPNSILHNSQDQGYSSIFSFFNGGGKYSTIRNDSMSLLEETNKLLDQLIDMFEMKQQNCIGEFKKFSECSRECGYGTQEQVYRIIQEKGPNGNDCPYAEGREIRKPCILRDCNIDEKCRQDFECRSRNCDNGFCKRVGECDKDHLYHCYNEDECVGLNGKYDTDSRNRYEWDSRTQTCSYEFRPKTEYRFFGKPEKEPGDEIGTTSTSSTTTPICQKVPDLSYYVGPPEGNAEPVCEHLNIEKIGGLVENCKKYFDGRNHSCVSEGNKCVVSAVGHGDRKKVPDLSYYVGPPEGDADLVCGHLNIEKIGGLVENCKNYYDGYGNSCVSGINKCIVSNDGPCKPSN